MSNKQNTNSKQQKSRLGFLPQQHNAFWGFLSLRGARLKPSDAAIQEKISRSPRAPKPLFGLPRRNFVSPRNDNRGGIFNSQFTVYHLPFTKTAAFTLAETMITLTIIGVIAAMTIPVIMKTTPNNNAIMFKKAYATLEKTIYNMINDEANYPSSMTGNDNNSKTVLAGLNYEAVTTNGTRNKFCYLFFDQLNTVSGGSTTCQLTSATYPLLNGPMITSDGITWWIYTPTADTTTFSATYSTSDSFPRDSTLYNTYIIIDINGTSKAPNCTADTFASVSTFLPASPTYTSGASCTSPDTFIIRVRYDGKLLVGCTSAVGATCSTTTDAKAISILSNPTTNN